MAELHHVFNVSKPAGYDTLTIARLLIIILEEKMFDCRSDKLKSKWLIKLCGSLDFNHAIAPIQQL